MAFSLAQRIEQRQAEQYDLHMRYINPFMARVQRIIGFDKIYTRGEGAYLWDVDGNRYLDLLSGYSVFNLGRNHPVIKQAMLEFLSLDRPSLVKMDCPLLAGHLLAAERGRVGECYILGGENLTVLRDMDKYYPARFLLPRRAPAMRPGGHTACNLPSPQA